MCNTINGSNFGMVDWPSVVVYRPPPAPALGVIQVVSLHDNIFSISFYVCLIEQHVYTFIDFVSNPGISTKI